MENPVSWSACLNFAAGGLQRWALKGREKRFFIKGWNAHEVAHCANTGSLKGCLEHAVGVWVKDLGESPTRKLRYAAQALELKDGALVGIHTGNANTLAGLWLAKQLAQLKAEAKWDAATRFDFCGTNAQGQPVWVEVKNVSMAADVTTVHGPMRVAMFPDAVTERGTKHLKILTEIAAAGGHAWQVYVVQRSDCAAFRPAAQIDPVYAAALRAAVAAGVRLTALACRLTPEQLCVVGELPIQLD